MRLLKKFYSHLIVLLIFALVSSCNPKAKETDNIFRFKEYISYNTFGNVSITKPIQIELAKQTTQFELSQQIPSEYLIINPKTEGTLYIENGTTLIFQPEKNLKPDTEYSVTLKLNRFYENINPEFKSYTFSFKTITPNFKINLGNLQSYSKEWQYLTGSVETSDYISLEDARKILRSHQEQKALHIDFPSENSEGTFFNFTIDSISRKVENSQIRISWDGKAIQSSTQGQSTLNIPGQSNFTIVDVVSALSPETSVSVNFSDPLQMDQNFDGLVQIDSLTNLRYEVQGNVLNIYPRQTLSGTLNLTLNRGIKNSSGGILKSNYTQEISFEQLKPQVRLISKGSILPASMKTPIYFEAVNLSAVDVRVIKVYQSNMLQYLQSNNLNSTESWDLKRVGRRVAKKTIPLINNSIGATGLWKAYAVDLSELFKADPGALYRVEFSFNQEYSLYPCAATEKSSKTSKTKEDIYFEEAYEAYYHSGPEDDEEQLEERFWDNELYSWRDRVYNWEEEDNPCHPAYYNEERFATTNVIGSDLGLIVKEGQNGTYDFITANLLSAKPEIGVEIKLYNYQQQLIKTIKTDLDGLATFKSNKSVAFAVAQHRNNYAYAKLDDGNALSLSNFDISGATLQKGLQGFIYTERGVHRPGDSIHLSFVLNDLANPLPKEHPVKLEVTDARGKLVQRSVLSSTLTNKGVDGGSTNGFYYFPIPTKATDPTGNWNATITVGGVNFNKTLRVATVKPNRLKIKLDFKKQMLTTTAPLEGSATATWLHGSPARNLKIDMTATLRSVNASFKNFKNYEFTDPVRSFEEVELPVLDQQSLSNEGVINFSKKISLSDKAPGMLQATFLTKVFEGGGDFSIDVFSKELAPYSHFVGLRAPQPHKYGSYFTDENIKFDLASVQADGKAAPNRKLRVQLFKMEWRWWFSRGSDNLSRYENSSVYTPIQDFEVTTDASGKTQTTINIPEEEGGRYLLRILDKESGHATGLITYFYRNWSNAPTSDSDSAKMLVFTSDKEHYKVGDEAIIKFPSDANSNALVSIENGTQVLSKNWVETREGETSVKIPITQDMAPNVYVNITLLQKHAQTLNDRPIRLYGVIPLLVENPATLLKPQLKMPKVLKPEQDFTIKVSEASNKKMTYTLAVVDEGLLDLTGFATPKIHEAFYARQALGVKTFDIYDYVIGAYSGSVDNIYAIGGGDAAAGAKNKKADRFKPVVQFLGPFNLEAGATATHKLHMPNYVGAVRTMLIAGNNTTGAYGNVEKSTPVNKPLMVLASLPRKLSPGETLTLPVTVFAMENKVKQASITVKTSNALKAINGTSKTIQFKEPGEQIVNFEFEVLPSDRVEKFEISVTGAGEKASYVVEIDVENPNPLTQKATYYTLEPNTETEISFETFGVPSSNTATVELSTLPQIDFTKRLQYLISYPYGCAEQTTSSGFPQIYLSSIFDLNADQEQDTQKNIKATISRLGMLQNTSGGVSYWPGERDSDAWATSYAGHFILEAQKQGFAPPITFLSNWLTYQQNAARQWRNGATSYNNSLTQAYRLYTLALAGQPELAAMNRLRESGTLTNDSRWRLAAAYALAGKKQVAQDLAKKANLNFVENDDLRFTYGSVLRNKAMALETMVLLADAQQTDLATSIAKDLSTSGWYSTQTTSYALLSLSKMLLANGGKSIDATLQTQLKKALKSEKGFVKADLKIMEGKNTITLKNNKNNRVYVSIIQQGQLPLGKELVEQRNFNVSTQFLDGQNKPIDVSQLRQGTAIKARITVTNTSLNIIDNVALTQIFPSGWEIVNTSFTSLGGGASGNARYKDIRDDRVNFYFELKAKASKTFEIDLNASYLGTYYLPGTQVEAMYDHNYFARTKGKWILVNQ
ncbi:alpha-2-macroglobulin family protein [Leeuwenhoekiella sp. W20_SRS_FM14]|uniref:alpha-2-macroglobulin family protein n=1 Tax=Leeuwenhoekiella sp. W20_SRS_FM14 TaxID=3240270 RepID=UPI003F9A49C0